MPCIKDSVTGLLIWHSGLLKSAPICKDLHIFIKLSSLREFFPEDPDTFIKIAYLIAIVVVGTLAASICKTLIYCMIHRIDDSLQIGSIASIHIIQ